MIFVEIGTTSDASRITIMKKRRGSDSKGLPWRLSYTKGGSTNIAYNCVQKGKEGVNKSPKLSVPAKRITVYIYINNALTRASNIYLSNIK